MSYGFFYDSTPFRLRNKSRYSRWLEQVVLSEKKTQGEINYIFCSDPVILRLNKQFLKHNYYTDIITFDYSVKDTISGEIYVSADTVSYNALKFKCPPAVEMRRVMVHGVLHLCGYKDKTEKDRQAMRNKEDFYLNLWPQIK